MPWAKRLTTPIPSTGSRRDSFEINDYSLGFNTYISNDKFPFKNGGTNMWRMAQDARIETLGEYSTRKGIDFHSQAVGETKDAEIISTSGSADQPFNSVNRLAQSFTTSSSGRLSRIRVNVKNDQGASGVVKVEIWSDESGQPGSLLGQSSLSPISIQDTYGYIDAHFSSAPLVDSSTDYWIVVYVQANSSGEYYWSSTTDASTALSSSDSGLSWASESFALNFEQYYASSGGVKGLIRAYKSDGTRITVFAHGTSLYSVDDVTGALTEIKDDLNAAATRYRFALVNDILYYCNSFDGLRKWDFSAESQVSSTNYSIILVHKGLLFAVRVDDPNRFDYSNFGEYETFTSTDFILVPAPKTGDPITALRSLNGYLIIGTVNNKFILSGDDNATFSLDEAPDQKGTFSQETMDVDANFIYYLSDDGVYRSNGSEPQLLSSDIYEDVANLLTKETATVTVNAGRLYVWFTPPGESENSRCYVFSLNYGDSGGTTESLDTNSFVSRGFSAFNDGSTLLVGSSRIGQIYWQEADYNDYSNLGGDINFELQTHYITGDSPAVLKEYRYWQPRFSSQSGDYDISIEFATDLRNNWQVYATPNVQGSGAVYGDGSLYADGTVYGISAEFQLHLYVPGEYRRVAFRYKHHATRQPHTFFGHTFILQTRRIR